MTMSLPQFITQLSESGLLTTDEITAFLENLSDASPSVDDLTKQLIEHKKLSLFQAQMICEGKGKKLLLGNYLIRDRIGSGGMGDVFLAEHRRMERLVALKTLPTNMMKNDQSIRRFHQEVKAAARLTHPNIVTAYDADEADGTHFLVMEYVPGQDLSAYVKIQGPFSIEHALTIILQAATGLKYAHEQGIIHRDIKPSNMLLDNTGTIKILDMGLARIDATGEDQPGTALTQSGSMMGTVDFMSPEQAASTHAADYRSDIYSLGCSFYFLVTGKVVYNGPSIISRILAHREHPIPSLCTSLAEIPSDVDIVYQKMIAKCPEDRFQSMQEVINAITNCELMQTELSSPILQKPLDVRHLESLPSDFVLNSRKGTAFQQITQEYNRTGKWGWILTAIAAASLLLLAGIVFKSETPAGTIVLEIDQPELAGAVVNVDGQQKLALKTGTSLERIRIPADSQSHSLEVSQKGYETFKKQFILKPDREESVRIRLKPLTIAENQSHSETENYALEFNGKSSAVELPGLKYDGTHPFTLEAFIRPQIPENEYTIAVALMMGAVNFRVAVSNKNSDTRFMLTTDIKAGKHVRLISDPCVRPVKAYHVAAIYDGKAIWLYLNGKQVQNPVEKYNEKNEYVPSKDAIRLDLIYPTALFQIGRTSRTALINHRFRGLIDEMRFSNIVRYTSNFTPAKRLKTDAHTMALYHFDAVGSDILKDSSGNGHDGRIIDARWVKVDDELNVINPGNN